MRSIFFLLAFGMLLLVGLPAHAQNKAAHVYEDSSILYPPSETTEVVPAPVEDQVITDSETEGSSSEEATNYIDTNLVKNKNRLSPDSMLLLKNSKPFAYAKVLDSLLKDLKKKQETKVNEKVEESPAISTGPSAVERFFNSGITKIIFWGLAIAFIIFIVVKLFLLGGYFERGTTKVKTAVIVEGEDHPDNLKERNFDNMINRAKTEQNFRLATRYLYLELLQKLSAAGAIEFAADKTNSEYMREITGKPYKLEVAQLTLNYEYVWYGEFAIDAATYEKIESRFRNVII